MATKKSGVEDERTAYHEVGHAIAADELDVEYGPMSNIPRDDGTAGRVGVEGDDFFSPLGGDMHSPENEQAFGAWAERQAVIDYAGYAAVVGLLGIGDMSNESAEKYGAASDFEKAHQRLAGDAKRIDQAQDRALEIVKARQEDVEKIAGLLIERGRLDSQQVDWVLSHGLPLPSFLDY